MKLLPEIEEEINSAVCTDEKLSQMEKHIETEMVKFIERLSLLVSTVTKLTHEKQRVLTTKDLKTPLISAIIREYLDNINSLLAHNEALRYRYNEALRLLVEAELEKTEKV